MNKLLVTVLGVALSGCGVSEIQQSITDYECDKSSESNRAGFILSCIDNANHKSDEEPEDWIHICQQMAEETYCNRVTVIVTKQKAGLNSRWVEVKREAAK